MLTIVAVSVVIAAPVLFQVIRADNTIKTSVDLQNLKNAITGNPRLVIEGGRADFGFVGTMGNVPSSLSELWLAGSQPTYDFNQTKKVGAGWVGPYVGSTYVEDLLSLEKDRFGSPYVYSESPSPSPRPDGAEVAVRITSGGPDGAVGTSDDMFVDVLKAEIFSTVTGELVRGTQTVPFASVTLNKPAGGVVSTTVTSTSSLGVFTFSNVPYGFRSVSIDPKLTFEPDSDNVQGGNTLRFTVTNFATNSVSITYMTVQYSTTMYFESIRIGNTTVFDYTWYGSTRASGISGCNTSLAFPSGCKFNFTNSSLVGTSVTVDGSGKPSQVVPIRVDKEVTTTPDLVIRGVGKSVTVQIQDFKNAATGSASNVNPTGATFTITFSDGSVHSFTV